MNKHLAIILIFLLIPLSWGCDRQKSKVTPNGKVVKIGVIAPMTGPDKKSGESSLLGIQTALQMQPYLKNGDKLELVVEDSKGSPVKAQEALGKIKDDKDISGVLVMGKSDSVLAMVPVADQYEVPILALVATHPEITKDNNFISQLSFDDTFQGDAAALFTRDEMLISRVAVFSDPNDEHYMFLAKEFIRKFTSVGGEIVEHVTTLPGEKDLPGFLERLRDRKVELLYLVVRPEMVIRIAHAVKGTGWKPKMIGSDGLASSILLKHEDAIPLVKGMMVTDFYSPDLAKTEYGRKASRIFYKSFSAPGTSYAALGCEGTSILINALDRCDNKSDRSCVNNRLRHTKGFVGLFGRISIYANGKAERPIFMNAFEGEHMKSIVKVY